MRLDEEAGYLNDLVATPCRLMRGSTGSPPYTVHELP